MSIIHTPPSHPRWCDREQCRTFDSRDGRETVHVHPAAGGPARVTLVRFDDDAPVISLRTDDDTTAMTAAEAEQLAAQLLAAVAQLRDGVAA